MEDEKYVYFQDLREKKVTGYSARKQRSHCGKRGRVKFPSDYLTKKELKNMSGECKSYRLNSPMTFKEFRAMPEDLQISYIKIIKEKWNPPVAAIAQMMDCDRANLSKRLFSLGFEKQPRGPHPWDKEGFAEWCYGVPTIAEEAMDEQLVEVPVEEVEAVEEEISATNEENISFVEVSNPGIKVNLIKEDEAPAFAYPISGSMSFEGKTKDIINTLSVLLLGKKVKLSVSWEVIND